MSSRPDTLAGARLSPGSPKPSAPSPYRNRLVALAWCVSIGVFPWCACTSTADGDCSDSYAADTVDFVFDEAISQVGEYSVELDSSAVKGSCHIAVGSTTLEPCSSARMAIDGLTRDGFAVLSGLHVWFDHAPPTMTLTVKSGEQVVLSEQYTPTYTSEPGGEGNCGTRQEATVTVRVPSEYR